MADYFPKTENDTIDYENIMATNPDFKQEIDEQAILQLQCLSNFTSSNIHDIELNIQCGIMASVKTDFTGRSYTGNEKKATLSELDEKQLQYSPVNQEFDDSLRDCESDGEEFLSEITNARRTVIENSYNRLKTSHKVNIMKTASTHSKIPIVRTPSTSCSGLDASSFKADEYVLETLFGQNQCADECNIQRKESKSNNSLNENFAILSCEVCQHNFVTKWGLKCHMANDHGMGTYTCDFCNKNYSYSFFAGDHDMDIHKAGLFECCVCNALFEETSELSEHKNSNHRVIKCLPSCEICAQNVVIEDIFYSVK